MSFHNLTWTFDIELKTWHGIATILNIPYWLGNRFKQRNTKQNTELGNTQKQMNRESNYETETWDVTIIEQTNEHGAACGVVVKLLDLDPQGWWFDPWCGHNTICTAVGPLSKALNPTLLQGGMSPA